MALPPFIHIWIFIAALMAQVLYAQNIDVLASQPVIHGEINGMKVMAQGDAVAFFVAGKKSPLFDNEECAHDLSCTMQKNRTEAVVFNPEGVWLFETPKMYAPENVTITEPLSPVSTEQFFSAGTFIKPTPIHIPLAFPQPTATLHTGNEVVDKTPGILLVSTSIREWLAATISTSGLVEEMPSRSADETLSPIIEPTPTQQKVMLTTISLEEGELLRKLTSTTTPVPTPVPTLAVNRMWEDGLIRLEIETDILSIKPSPSGQYGSSSETSHSFTFSVKQVPTVTEGSTSGNREASSTASGSTTTDSQQANPPPALKGEKTSAHCDSIKSQPPKMTNVPKSESLRQESAAATGSSIENEHKHRIIVTGLSIDKEKAKAVAEQEFHDFMARNQLTIDDLKKLVKRCAPEKEYHVCGLSTMGRKPILKLLAENRFASLSRYVDIFETWLSIPEYTADQKHKLLAKLRKKEEWKNLRVKLVLETPQETAERVAAINQMTDEEIHREYHDELIHKGMMVDSRKENRPYGIWRQYIEDYTAQEKREILYRHFRLYPKPYCDENAYRFLWDGATDDYVHEHYSDDKIRALEAECEGSDQK